ncbi:MAG: imidazolonepropionase [Kiloniellales bacterium]
MTVGAFDHLWINARLASMVPGAAAYGGIEAGAIAVKDGKIAWVGRQSNLPADAAASTEVTEDAEGRWITPGLIDCHTHLVYGGDRAAEFELRLEGASYEEIAKAGGGIVSTVKATRAASEDALVADALPRLDALLAEGVTTIEIKSGYGLALAEESKMLRAARRLGELRPVTVKTSFLGAHALPPEYQGRQGDYVDAVEAMIPKVAAEGLADAVDAFGERIAFTPDEVARVFTAASAAGLPVKLHADQLSDQGGAGLAARFGALSADHLEYASEAGLAAMAQAGSVAVLLPGAFYVLRETKLPPIEACRRLGVGMAIATDSNPGSSPVTSLLLMLSMACTLFRMTPEESLAGITREAAKALGLGKSHGTLEVGKQADLCIWDIERPAELAYRVGFNPLHQVVHKGRVRSAA